MNRKGFYVWVASLIVLSLSLIPFIFFMFNLYVKNLMITIISITIGTILYIIGNRLITHKKGYTLFQAVQFYKTCVENGFDSTKKCKLNVNDFKSLASNKDYSENLTLAELFEMYSIGYDFCNKRKG